MKFQIPRYLLFILLTISLKGFSQKITTAFYDYTWKPCDVSKARFFSTLENTDSGWFRNDYFISTKQLQMSALYKDSACKIRNGNIVFFHANGNLHIRGNYIDNKREGIHISYHFNGIMADSGMYANDKLVQWKFAWHPNGFMADSIYQRNDSTTIHVSWFDNDNIDKYGYFINQKKHGKWNYFHRNGNIACTEMLDHGKIISVQYFDETGKEQTDTSSVTSEAVFKKGPDEWKKYINGKLYWPAEYQITNSDVASVVISFTINEEGKVVDADVTTPFHHLMDKIAIDVIKKSPLWKPRLDHNRKVKQLLRQSVTFRQDAN